MLTYTLFYCLGDTGGHHEKRVLAGPHGAESNGYLQWEEVNPEAKYIATADPAISTRALDSLFMKSLSLCLLSYKASYIDIPFFSLTYVVVSRFLI